MKTAPARLVELRVTDCGLRIGTEDREVRIADSILQCNPRSAIRDPHYDRQRP
jgi:hypothetical protein